MRQDGNFLYDNSGPESYGITITTIRGGTQVTIELPRIWQPCWSPNSEQIAAVRGSQYYFHPHSIVLFNKHGKLLSIAAKEEFQICAIRFSPKNDYLSYYVGMTTAEGWNLKIVRTDGKDPTQVTSWGPVGLSEWSPDGRHLAFTTKGEVWVYSLEARNARRLINLVQYDESLAGHEPLRFVWSPDASNIACEVSYQGKLREGESYTRDMILLILPLRGDPRRVPVGCPAELVRWDR